MDLKKYDGKHVRITDKWGETFAGMAEYGNSSFLECEYGGEEDGIFIEDCLIYHSQIVSIRDKKQRRKKLEKWEKDWLRRNSDIVNLRTKYTDEENKLFNEWGG